MATRFLVVCSVVAMVAGRSDVLESANQLMSSPFKACIDDSDCMSLEGQYACFQYICYPYADDSIIAPQARKERCTRKEECADHEMCFRHHDLRNINKGLCMEELGNCQEKGDSDCRPNKCCNGQFCCHEEFFNQLKNLNCLNHLMCKDLGYGDFCCPVKGSNSSVCCDTNPNPPPPPRTEAPKATPLSGALSTHLASAFILVTSLLAIRLW